MGQCGSRDQHQGSLREVCGTVLDGGEVCLSAGRCDQLQADKERCTAQCCVWKQNVGQCWVWRNTWHRSGYWGKCETGLGEGVIIVSGEGK